MAVPEAQSVSITLEYPERRYTKNICAKIAKTPKL